MALPSILIEPVLARWPSLLAAQSQAAFAGQTMEQWQRQTRAELGLPANVRILATGHQPALWHPGIMAKYAAVDAVLRERGDRLASGLNVIVDQDVVECASFDVPVRRSDGALSSRQIELAPSAAAKDVPIGRMPAFAPREVDVQPLAELPGLADAVQSIRSALAAEAHQPSAAAQTAAAVSRLTHACAGIEPLPSITASHLMTTTIARELLRAMADDPHRCARAYNDASAAFPEARLAPLSIRDEYVELPIWRVRDHDGSRMHGYDSDVEAFLAGDAITLLPRALLMTAIIRLAAADLFVHGTGGAQYDRAMERWIRDWLGVAVSPMATVSATLRLPLMKEEEWTLVRAGGLGHVRNCRRWLRHDPQAARPQGVDAGAGGASRPSAMKQALLREIDSLPARSPQRRAAFFEMHRQLDGLRRAPGAAMAALDAEIERLQRLTRNAETAQRRDWAFPLYPSNMLRELVERIRAAAAGR